jgi:hypothetical protein
VETPGPPYCFGTVIPRSPLSEKSSISCNGNRRCGKPFRRLDLGSFDRGDRAQERSSVARLHLMPANDGVITDDRDDICSLNGLRSRGPARDQGPPGRRSPAPLVLFSSVGEPSEMAVAELIENQVFGHRKSGHT